MKHLLTIALALAPTAVALPAVAADTAQPERQGQHRRHAPTAEDKARHEARKKEWEAMTPEQREARRQAHEAEREARMTPEEKARHEARKKEWEAMTPEQREAKRQEMKARGGKGDRPQRGERPAPPQP